MQLIEELRKIVGDVEIISDSLFYVDGKEFLVLPAINENSAQIDNKQGRIHSLVFSLTNALYHHFYIRNREKTCTNLNVDVIENINLTAEFLQSNMTQEHWDHGWKIYSLAKDGRIFVQKGERSRAAVRGTYCSKKWTAIGAQVGDYVSLRVFPSTSELQAAFFHSFGDTLADQFDEFSSIRFYFNVKAEYASGLLSQISRRLNHYLIPFHYKTLVYSSDYCRADAAVLYVAKRYYQIVATIILDLVHEFESGFEMEVPLFSWRLANGVGVAEDPGTGESFGMHRCCLVAQGLFDAWILGDDNVVAKLAAVEHSFSQQGFQLERAYLNSESLDIFQPALSILS